MTVLDDRVWDVDLVAGLGEARYVALALDVRRRPIIAAWRGVESPEARLTLARRDGAEWETEDVARGFGAYCSLALDTAGSPMVVYVDLDHSTVMLAQRTASNEPWNLETVAAGAHGLIATGPALALGRDGQPAVCYASDAGIHLATRDTTGTWTVQPIAAAAGSAGDVALAIDGDGAGHVLVRDPFRNTLAYVTDRSGTWQSQAVPWRDAAGSGGFLGDGPSLAVDRAGRPHVAYWTHAGIRHATLVDADWQIETVIAGTGSGPSPSLALDADGSPTIANFNAETGAVDVAWHDAGGWHRDVIAPSGSPRGIGGFVSLAVDDLGIPHIAYVDDASGIVRSTRLNRAPDVPPLRFSTLVNTAITGRLYSDDADREGDMLTVTLDATLEPEHGRVRLRPDGSFTYTPGRGYNGPDTFRFEVVDSGGLATTGEADIQVDVPVLIEARHHPLDDGRRSSQVRSAFRSPDLNELVGRIQRLVHDVWVDVRLGTGSRITQMVNPRPGEWETGPYRIEIRPLDRSYPLARSEEFDMPPARGVELVLRGIDGGQLVIQGNESVPRLVLLARDPDD